jgi:phytoene desaturase
VTPARTLVIGGGLGGLAVALRLAARGVRVTIFEQAPTLGGKMNLWETEGFRFDTGPSLITMPWIFEELFEAAGTKLCDHIVLTEVQPLARYVFDDGTRFTYTTSMPSWLETIRRLEPRDEEGFLRYMALGARLFELSRATFFAGPPLARLQPGALRALRRAPLRHAWGNYHNAVCAHFRSPHLRQLFDRYTTYVGSSPYRTPATLTVIPYIEHAFGGWHVHGGLYRLVEALADIARRRGVVIETGARVVAVEQESGRVAAVRLAGGKRHEADIVVMNGDPSLMPGLLAGGAETTLPPEDRSLSGFVMLFAVRKDLPEIGHHTVCFSADYEEEFHQLFDRRRFPKDPTVYVSAPSRTDRTLVPGRGETLFVMANAPATDPSEWGEDAVREATRRVLERLKKSGFPSIEGEIVATSVWSPPSFARAFAAPGGAIYGTHSHGWRRAFLRPPNRDRRVRGLYYVGGGTHPGGGTPTVLLSARITAGLVLRDQGLRS